MKFYIACAICFALGFFACALFSNTKTAKLKARLQSAEKIIGLAIKVIGDLGLWDTIELDELSKAIDKHEEGG